MAGLGDLAGLFGQVKNMQANMQRMQKELAQKTIQASSGGGMVTATVNGKGDLIDIKIERDAGLGSDLEMLEVLVKAAVNAAVEKSRAMMKEELAKLSGGLNLPGMDQLGNMFG